MGLAERWKSARPGERIIYHGQERFLARYSREISRLPHKAHLTQSEQGVNSGVAASLLDTNPPT